MAERAKVGVKAKPEVKADTKQEILDAALELFSTQGYEATSVSQIADAVGIRKASLYSHFASKQEILDRLLQVTSAAYEKHSIFAQADGEAPASAWGKEDLDPETAVERILSHIRYILHDPHVSRVRKMLTIEQFCNPQMAVLQTKRSYADIMGYFTRLMQHLIDCGVMIPGDPEVTAAQFCLPVSVWINLCDREPEREAEVAGLIERHVRQFFAVCGKSGKA